MNDLIKTFKKKLKFFLNFLEDNPNVLNYLKCSLAISSLTFIVYFLIPKRRQRLVIYCPPNIGYLRLIKPEINKYTNFIHNFKIKNSCTSEKNLQLLKYVKKFYAVPNGISNYGSNCYINVLLQVYSKSLYFSAWQAIQISFNTSKTFVNSKENKFYNQKNLK